MAGPLLTDTSEDVEEFIDKVSEVHRLIEGLKAGTISPEYIDSKQLQKEEKEREKLALERKCPAGRGPSQPVSASSENDVENEQDAEAERRERAMEKVKELMGNRERKLRARVRYEEYVRSQDKTKFGTDYTKWDIWCPEDEEDDLINSIGPNTAQFRAMEKDIDERHRQMVERRQLAERCRVAGNTAYGAKQYSEALRCYQQGIESERTNMALHANAAMAALKISCFVQAVEHCDKVLSIAEFLHNNKNHPLCVKALQRRAEAFRALQQPSRAVQDLEAALALEPGNAEAAKQLARARQEGEEARKQRAIAKAVSKAAASGSAPGTAPGSGAGSAADDGGSKASEGGRFVVEAGGLALDLEKLGRVERLAAALAPSSSLQTNGEVAAGTGAEGGKGSAEGKGASGAGARRGPVLPPRTRGGTPAAESGGGKAADATSGGDSKGGSNTGAAAVDGGLVAVCRQLRELLVGDDACCVYLRECGGLAHVAARISKCPAGDSASQQLPALLLLLNDACMNDGNLSQLLSLRVLPSVTAALDGLGPEAAGAAASLLCTAVTVEDVRQEVSRLLGGGSGREAQLLRLVRLLAGAKPAVQGVALALLGNCMVDKPTKTAMAALWRQDAAAATCFLDLLRSPTPVLAEKATVLLGNMATDAALRAEILACQDTQDGVVRQLLMLAVHGTGSPAKLQPQQQQQQQEMRRAAATALFNLTVEERGQQLVAEDADGLAKLYGMATSRQQDGAMAVRAAGICARAAKVGAGMVVLLRQGAISGMLRVVTEALNELGGSGGAAAGVRVASQGGATGADDHTVTLLDAAVRTLTVLTAPDDPNLAAQLVAAGGISALLRVVRIASGGTAATGGPSSSPAAAATGAGALGESVLANAALCVAGLARYREHLPALRAADPVPVLLGVAYTGRGNTPSKNAAIALARLAHEPAMLEQLRELHGIEIIYQYVKP